MRGIATVLVVLLCTVSTRAQDPQQLSSPPSPTRPGGGNNPIDPSENVKALSEAANKRQDDLRLMTERLMEAKLAAIKETTELNAVHNKELRESAIQRLDAENKLRAEFTERLLIAEAKRIDAIRAVDVNAVAVNAKQTSDQATALQVQTQQQAEVLRNQVARSAEDLRALVATTATTALQNQQQQFNGILTQMAALSTRLTQLEQLGAEGKGRQAPPDPVITALLTEVRSLQSSRSQTMGVDTGRGDVIGWIVGGIGLLIALGAFGLNLSRRPATTK